MNRHTFNYLENMTYAYYDTLRQIKEIEEELIHGKPERDDIQAGRTNVRNNVDITANKAIALTEDKRLQRLREQSRAVEKAYNSLIDEKKELVELYYWEKPYQKNISGIAQELNLSNRTAYRWRREYIHKLGKILGEI